MKTWAFVSDFDGTISKEDFYWLVINKYFPEGQGLFDKWKRAELLDIDFLSQVFASIHQDEEQIIADILSISIDEHVPSFIKKVQENNGDFYVLSAGTDYYIHHILKQYGIENVKVFSNEGYFREKNVFMNIDETHRHYSKRYGIDKTKVILELKEQYEHIYFSGDSEPDSHPAAYADITFAKDALQDILREKNIPFVAVDTFKEIETYLIEKGVLS
ncbi:MtnX-like HAD-IB family phosphatase [Anaerobacillus isosaccharinicus]|uniref:2,3-diketo-5-methylthio-1-phosphopentane phosphatase n=1 Tax=Anaerobacillus isosaccharinicus TaxID=1532552 RepID=A0A1S2LI42_9BACI|nr:MtnX-like HAD-IB family phosphatase [Anaerobacillus isosaccharinicus]MBA5586157.1 MtnX-like HAD-IB family phosphatase [Anaerobacillus isosaccharinicus]QOY35578.1 MtnX-like HAD-IB family phosphatase [Anaerobacillus isosaccharinicus]